MVLALSVLPNFCMMFLLLATPRLGPRRSASSVRSLASLSASPASFDHHMKATKTFHYVTAPMVAQSELAFRLLTARYGSTMSYTQMLHARNFVASKRYRRENYDFDRALGLEGLASTGKPVIAQLAGDDVSTMVQAAKILEASGVDAIDVNLGCPQAIARKGNYGAYLGRQADAACGILAAMKGAVSTPITAKVRIQPDLETTLRICREIEKTGVSMMTVHGRTLEENKTATKCANWDAIKAVVEALDIPVIGNGGM